MNFRSDLLIGLLFAPILLMHMYAKAGVLLRPPLSVGLKLTLPLVVAAGVTLTSKDPDMFPLATALLIPYIQWLIVWLLYGWFQRAQGRPPRDVFMKVWDTPGAGPDALLLYGGFLALVFVPLALLAIAVSLSTAWP